MLRKDDCARVIKSFRARHGLDASDENVIATVHLMNTHGLDAHAALDQSSRSGNDHGVDAWHYDEAGRELFIYQSKLTESRPGALRGFNDLAGAAEWVGGIVVNGTVDAVPSDNHCLFGLYTLLSQVRDSLKMIRFVLLSPFERMELEDSSEYQQFEQSLIGSELNACVRGRLGGRLVVDAVPYNLEHGVPAAVKMYAVDKIPEARIGLRRNAHLDLAYVSLHSLVDLYRQRGDVLFDKNVRLSLVGTKEARERLVNPMENTLDLITSGKLSPSIFPFYHIGVTISASSVADEDTTLLNLAAPSIINGCQTITIASEYLKRLERQADARALERFKQIKVVAKVVVGTTNEELKEITNSNNRQNPIENWQLFSNEPIHVEIEAALKDVGVFYERQKGKFDSVMRIADNARHYHATRGTYVKVVDLGQLIALSRKNLQWAAKPSEVFLNKENHDRIFDRSVPRYPRDIVLTANLMKAVRRGLNKYLELPTHANGHAPLIFKKPIVRTHVYYLAILYYYQRDSKGWVRSEFSRALNKIANPRLVEESKSFYQKVVTRVKNWYLEASKDLSVEVSKKSMDRFFDEVSTELGIDTEGGTVPFTPTSVDGVEY
jgi:AIPR protein